MTFEEIINQESKKEYFIKLQQFLDNEYQTKTIYPPRENLFYAFTLCPLEKVKVVIMGQDPYHEKYQAQGLAFSVNDGVKLPKSLGNIFKELYNDLHVTKLSGDLSSWGKQGVLLLNSVLSVEEGKPNSHKGHGWEIFTNEVIKLLNEDSHPKVFVLWGKEAFKYENLITNSHHLIIKSSHPSPLSAHQNAGDASSFIGSKPFSKINDFLRKNGLETINWGD
jgi:uracil-DNA glycosylase